MVTWGLGDLVSCADRRIHSALPHRRTRSRPPTVTTHHLSSSALLPSSPPVVSRLWPRLSASHQRERRLAADAAAEDADGARRIDTDEVEMRS